MHTKNMKLWVYLIMVVMFVLSSNIFANADVARENCTDRTIESMSFTKGEKEFRKKRATPVICGNSLSPPKCRFPFTHKGRIYDNCTEDHSKDGRKKFACSFDLSAMEHYTKIAPCDPTDTTIIFTKGPILPPRFFSLRGTHVIYACFGQVLELKCPAEHNITILGPQLGYSEQCTNMKPVKPPTESIIDCIDDPNLPCCKFILAEMRPVCNNQRSCNFSTSNISQNCQSVFNYMIMEYFCTEKLNCIELVDAAKWRNQSKVEDYLHSHQCDVNSRGEELRTALFHAASNNDIDMVKTLLSRGADRLLVNHWYETPLAHALAENHADIALPLLLLQHCDPNISWWQAVYQGDTRKLFGPANLWHPLKNATLEEGIENAIVRDRDRVSKLRMGHMEVKRTLWSSWGSCSETCGIGFQFRTKHCSLVDLRNDQRKTEIFENYTDSKPCKLVEWSSWGQWQNCSVTCGNGTRVRKKLCVRNSTSEMNASETELCVNDPCYDFEWYWCARNACFELGWILYPLIVLFVCFCFSTLWGLFSISAFMWLGLFLLIFKIIELRQVLDDEEDEAIDNDNFENYINFDVGEAKNETVGSNIKGNVAERINAPLSQESYNLDGDLDGEIILDNKIAITSVLPERTPDLLCETYVSEAENKSDGSNTTVYDSDDQFFANIMEEMARRY